MHTWYQSKACLQYDLVGDTSAEFSYLTRTQRSDVAVVEDVGQGGGCRLQWAGVVFSTEEETRVV